MRALYSLYLLISTPPPNIGWFVMPAVVLVGSYMALSPFDAVLSAVGLPAFVLSVVLMHVALAARGMPVLLREREARDWAIEPLRTALWLNIGILGVFLIAADPLWCQRGWTIYLVFRAAALAYGIAFDRDFLGRMPWIGRYFGIGQGNAARWAIAGDIMLILINEAAILYGTLDQWIALRALAQPVVYALVYWTILATHPCDDEPDT